MAGRSDPTFSMRLDADVLAELDSLRGEQSRTAWIAEAVAERLGRSGKSGATALKTENGKRGATRRPDGDQKPNSRVDTSPAVPAVRPADCKHPINRRIGDYCAVCGATVKK